MPAQDIPERGESDIDSDMNEPESNLTGFVVSDDDVEYDDDHVPRTFAMENRRFTIDDSDDELDDDALPNGFSTQSNPPSTAGTIEISDGRCRCIDISAWWDSFAFPDDDVPTLPTRSSRRRRIQLDSDDEESDNDLIQYLSDDGTPESNEDPSDSQDNLDEVEYRSAPRHMYSRPDISDEDESDYYDDDFAEDPFTRPSHVSRFIDDAADEDDEEADTTPQRPQKLDPITETINRARIQMEQNKTSSSNTNNAAAVESSSDSSSSDDDSDAPDYEFMISQPKPTAAPPSSSSALAAKPTPAPPKPQTKEGEGSSTEASKNKSKEKRKRAKRNKKNRAKQEKKKHKPNE